MKGKVIALGVGSLLVFGIIMVAAQPSMGFAKEDYLKYIDQKVELAFAWTEYEICNPNDYDYLNGMALQWFGDTSIILSREIQIRNSYLVPIDMPVYGLKEFCRDTYANETGKHICENRTVEIGKMNIYKEKIEWKAWNGKIDSKPTLSSVPRCERVRVYAKLKPTLGPKSIDHVPSVFGYNYPEYSWWDLDWNKKRGIDLNTSLGSDTNFQFKVTIPYDADMQTDFEDIRCVNSTEDGMLPCWNETQVDSDFITLWIHLNETTDATIFIYYDNAVADDNWDGNATLMYFEDFETMIKGSSLSGQGGWELIANDPIQVITDFAPYEGGQSVVSPDGHSTMTKALAGDVDNGTATVWLKSNSTQNSHRFYLYEGANPKIIQRLWTRDIEYHDGGGWRVLVGSTDTNYYKFNYSWTTTTQTTYCASNVSSTSCLTDTNFGGAVTVDGIGFITDDSGPANNWAHWDLVYVANMTSQGLAVTIGNEATGGPPDVTPPVIWIQRPANTTYLNSTVWFNATMNETGGACVVAFGGTNKTMVNSSGNWNYFNGSMLSGDYNAIFWCDDASNNYNTTSVRFAVDTCFYANSTGDWDVNETCVIVGEWFNIDGNLTIQDAALLNITNTTLNFTGSHQWLRFENGTQTDKLLMIEFSGIN